MPTTIYVSREIPESVFKQIQEKVLYIIQNDCNWNGADVSIERAAHISSTLIYTDADGYAAACLQAEIVGIIEENS